MIDRLITINSMKSNNSNNNNNNIYNNESNKNDNKNNNKNGDNKNWVMITRLVIITVT